MERVWLCRQYEESEYAFFARVTAIFDEFLQGFKHYLEAEDPDILIITETKVRQTGSLALHIEIYGN